jgi:hypothetical protein
MSRSPSQRWALIGGFAVAAVYAVVALVEVFVNSNAAAAIPFAYVGVCIAGPLAVVARFVGSPHAPESGDEGPGGGNGPGPSDDGDGDPGAPPWWGEFEQEFWAQVDAPRPSTPVHAHDRVTPAR